MWFIIYYYGEEPCGNPERDRIPFSIGEDKSVWCNCGYQKQYEEKSIAIPDGTVSESQGKEEVH